MSGSTLKHREDREIVFRFSSNKHVEVITKEILISGRVTAPAAVGLRKLAPAAAIRPRSASADSF